MNFEIEKYIGELMYLRDTIQKQTKLIAELKSMNTEMKMNVIEGKYESYDDMQNYYDRDYQLTINK